MNINSLGIIPSRYYSSRFPGKPLAVIKGVSMIERVYKQSIKAEKLKYILVATDDNRIYKHVTDFGGKAILTSKKHKTGTDRCYEAVMKFSEQFSAFKPDVIVNIQGDEPLISPEIIDKLVSVFETHKTDIATVGIPYTHSDKDNSPNTVKIVKNNLNYALYFSRATIPFLYNNNNQQHKFLKHIGIYAYNTDVLKKISNLPQSALEKAESLEQLRWLENGFNIYVLECDTECLCVDVPDDIIIVEDFMNKNSII